MGTPQIIWIILVLLDLGVNLALHGEPRNTNYSFGTALINVGINVVLLWCGGFFG